MELNKNAFRDIFYNKLAENGLKVISQKQFFRFLCDLRIFPDLVSALSLKRLLQDLKQKKKGEINEKNFAQMIYLLACHCFPTGDSIKNFLIAIKSQCREVYKVCLITKPASQVKIRKNLKISPEKREISTQRKILNKSTSQKLSLSGLISPKNNTTVVKKLSLARSPVIKVLKSANKSEKLQKILEIFKKFKESQANPSSPSHLSQQLCPFFEHFLLSKMQTVIPIQSLIRKLHFELWRLKTKLIM